KNTVLGDLSDSMLHTRYFCFYAYVDPPVLHSFPTRRSSDLTVLAAYTLALASGAKPLEAAHIANIAGGLVVMKRGTATVSRQELDRKSTRLNSSHVAISYAVFCLKKKRWKFGCGERAGKTIS